jgi:gluconokinase
VEDTNEQAKACSTLTVDAGSSSVRTLLYDGNGRQVKGFGSQLSYEATTTADGGVEIDADKLLALAVRSLSDIHGQMQSAGRRPSAFAFSTFWHNVMGVDSSGMAATPIVHPFDTRSAGAAKELAGRIDGAAQHSRTGCVLHPSYWPPKLLWLSESEPDVFRRVKKWMSFGEYFFLKLFGEPVASTSMVSGSGLWNQNQNDYDAEMLSVLPIDGAQLCPVDQMDQPMTELGGEYRRMWPQYAGIPWFPALGDGACDNIGSGCLTPDRFALMVGTSGAMRAVCEAESMRIPPGLFCYRVDRRRFVLGGALSNGGEVYHWMKRTLSLPGEDAIEQQLAAMQPGAHGLTVLPLFAGERSTKWRADARAAITGMSVHTSPMEILRASLESVALRFRNIFEIMLGEIGEPSEMVDSGSALLHSPTWTQMMADALGRPVIPCLEKEATSRGAALLAMERIGAIGHVRDRPAEMGPAVQPVAAHLTIYEEELRRQRQLYAKLFEEN